MKVFISWSGDLSKKIAIALKEWIPNVLQSTEPYVSSEDIDKGSRWSTDIAKELADSTYGILCVTKDNFREPWLNFEAGALSKKIDSSKVCPLLYNVKRSEIDGPLLQFQVTVYKKDDVFKLMNSLNNSCTEQQLPEDRLNKTFELWWPKLEEALQIDNSKIISQKVTNESNTTHNDAILEEILSLVQTQQKILRKPEELLPPEYILDIMKLFKNNTSGSPLLKNIYYQIFKGYEDLQIVIQSHLKLLDSIEGMNKDVLLNAQNVAKACNYLRKPINYARQEIMYDIQSDDGIIIGRQTKLM